MFNLHDKVACVTGASGLLGREFCKALSDSGAQVVGVDVLPNDDTGDIDYYQLDLSNEQDVIEFRKYIESTYGRVDILVNSAAVDPKAENLDGEKDYVKGKFTSYSVDSWNLSLSVNLTGMFLITRELCKLMETCNSGKIINISSTYGLCGPDQRIYQDRDGKQRMYKPVDYTVTKSAVIGFTKYLAAYYRDSGIRANALTPGGTFNNNDEIFVDNYSSRTIVGRMANPKDYRGAIVYLSSDESDYMTGSNLIVDGGWTAL